MPNHCENRTTIFGSPKDLAEVLEIITLSKDDQENQRQTYALTNLYPMPEILRGTISPAPDSAEPHPSWVLWLKEGSWTQEEYDAACEKRIVEYELAEKAKAQTGYDNWYDWCLAHWGTKWGDYSHSGEIQTIDKINLVAEKASLHFDYDTAWGPLDRDFWAEVSGRFPELRFETRYSEPGMCFAGAYSAHHGCVGEAYVEGGRHSTSSLEYPEIDWEADDGHQVYADKMDELYEALALEADLSLAQALGAAEASL